VAGFRNMDFVAILIVKVSIGRSNYINFFLCSWKLETTIETATHKRRKN
jgi:hypothetical protein